MADMLRKKFQKDGIPKYRAIIPVEKAHSDNQSGQGLRERLMVTRLPHSFQLVILRAKLAVAKADHQGSAAPARSPGP
jgi:hypothetical protein